MPTERNRARNVTPFYVLRERTVVDAVSRCEVDLVLATAVDIAEVRFEDLRIMSLSERVRCLYELAVRGEGIVDGEIVDGEIVDGEIVDLHPEESECPSCHAIAALVPDALVPDALCGKACAECALAPGDIEEAEAAIHAAQNRHPRRSSTTRANAQPPLIRELRVSVAARGSR